jgi:hypothetical protein
VARTTSALRLQLVVPYDYHNQQQLFPEHPVYLMETVCFLRGRTENLNITQMKYISQMVNTRPDTISVELTLLLSM